MSRINLMGLNSSSSESLVSVADIQRVRRQRRLAQTEEEYGEVRSHMRAISGELKIKPTGNSQLLKISGIVIIVLGLIMGAALFYAASFI